MQRTLVLILLVAPALAGCLGDTADDATSVDTANADAEGAGQTADAADGVETGSDAAGNGNDSAAGALDPTRSLHTLHNPSCREFHLVYVAAASDFVGFLPPGFSLVTSDPSGTLADLLIFVTFCDDVHGANTTETTGNAAEMRIELPVIRPEGLAVDEAGGDRIVLDWIVDDARALAQYASWGMDVARAGDVQRTVVADNDPFLAETMTVRSGSETYRIDTNVRLAPTEWPDIAFRLWHVDAADAVVGYVMIQGGTGIDLGLGANAFTYQGSGLAPPAYGGIAHTVDEIERSIWYRTLA